jgi:hypothetical protein
LIASIRRPTTAQSTKEAYLEAGRLLLRGNATSADLGRLGQLGLNEPYLSIVARAITSELQFEDAYRELIAAPPDSDILLSHVREKMRAAVVKDVPEGHRALNFAWIWGHAARAATVAFDRTGDTRFVDELLFTFDEIVALRDFEEGLTDAVRGRILRAWGGTFLAERVVKKRYFEKGIVNAPIDEAAWTTNVVTNGRICYPVAYLCRQLSKDRGLAEKYERQIARCVGVVQEVVDEFMPEFVQMEDGTGYFSRWTNRNLREALNHQNSFGLTLIHLSDLTGKAIYREVAEMLAKYFKASIRREPNGAYVWGYRGLDAEFSRSQLVEDVGHAHLNVHFAREAFDEGIVFTKSDMKGFQTTFLNNIHRGDSSFIASISPDGKNLALKRHHPGHIAGWMLLADLDPRIRDVIELAVAYRTDLYPEGWFSDRVTPTAYAYRFPSR